MPSKKRRPARNRRKPDPSFARDQAFVVATPTISSAKLRLTFSVPPAYSGATGIQMTGGLHGSGASPTAVNAVTPTVFDLTFANPVIATNVCVIPNLDPGFRSATGAFVKGASTTL